MPRDIVKAQAEVMRRAAIRGADDPAELSRATRIVRVAVERGQVELDELAQPIPGGLEVGPTLKELRHAERRS